MKKIIAILAVCLLAMLACTALADEEAPYKVINYDDALMEKNIDHFETLEDFGFMFYVPENADFVDPTAEELAQGIYYKYVSEDGKNVLSISYVAVNDADGNPINDIETLNSLYLASGASTSEIVTLNFIDCVRYTVKAVDMTANAYLVESGAILVFAYTPSGNFWKNSIDSVMEAY